MKNKTCFQNKFLAGSEIVPVPRRLEGKARERKGEGAVPNKYLVGSKIVPVLQGLNYLVPAYIKLSQTGS